jgi:hypothetical protein
LSIAIAFGQYHRVAYSSWCQAGKEFPFVETAGAAAKVLSCNLMYGTNAEATGVRCDGPSRLIMWIQLEGNGVDTIVPVLYRGSGFDGTKSHKSREVLLPPQLGPTVYCFQIMVQAGPT